MERASERPPQLVRACFWKVGSNDTARKCTPGKARWLRPSTNRSGRTHGAPMSSNGRVVPRPSEAVVPSNNTVPG